VVRRRRALLSAATAGAVLLHRASPLVAMLEVALLHPQARIDRLKLLDEQQ
jgi:hypothetical protein